MAVLKLRYKVPLSNLFNDKDTKHTDKIDKNEQVKRIKGMRPIKPTTKRDRDRNLTDAIKQIKK